MLSAQPSHHTAVFASSSHGQPSAQLVVLGSSCKAEAIRRRPASLPGPEKPSIPFLCRWWPLTPRQATQPWLEATAAATSEASLSLPPRHVLLRLKSLTAPGTATHLHRNRDSFTDIRASRFPDPPCQSLLRPSPPLRCVLIPEPYHSTIPRRQMGPRRLGPSRRRPLPTRRPSGWVGGDGEGVGGSTHRRTARDTLAAAAAAAPITRVPLFSSSPFRRVHRNSFLCLPVQLSFSLPPPVILFVCV
jgi:hypothetical protein